MLHKVKKPYVYICLDCREAKWVDNENQLHTTQPMSFTAGKNHADTCNHLVARVDKKHRVVAVLKARMGLQPVRGGDPDYLGSGGDILSRYGLRG